MENHRITYNNLKTDSFLNAFTYAEKQDVWLPTLIYANTDQKETTRLGWENEWSISVKVSRDGTFTRQVLNNKEILDSNAVHLFVNRGTALLCSYFYNRSGVDEVDEREIFEGSENRLIMIQTYTHEFQCVYKLESYPFDAQTCTIDITTSHHDKAIITMIPKNLHMEQDVDMTLFHMDYWKLDFRNRSAPQEGVSMTIVLRRKILSEMMGTYLPSLLLMMITFATTLFKPFFFEAALSVNLTTMLVMTTIFISKMESLPPTSATKMIDYWLILCQLVPFTEVVLLTAMEYHREDKDDMEEPDDVKEPKKDPEDQPNADEPVPEVSLEAWKAPKNGKKSSRPDLRMIGTFGLTKIDV